MKQKPLRPAIGRVAVGLPAAWFLAFSLRASAQTPEPPPAPTAQELFQAAAKELERAETLDESELTSGVLSDVNRSLVALQGAERTHARLPYLYGRLYALAGRRGDAIEQFRRFVETREGRNEWEAHRRLGDLFIEEFPRLAQGSYERAAQLKAGEPTVLVGLSLAAYKAGRIDEAVRIAKEAADADGRKSVRVVSHLSRMHIAKQQWAEAERAAQTAMELAEAGVKAKPGSRGPLRTLDSQFQLLSDLLWARVNERAATADDYVRLAGLIRKRDELGSRINLHEVLRVLEAGVNATAPNTPMRLLEQYAVTLAEVGRADEAIASFEKLLAADPSNVTATEWLARLRESQPAAKQSP
jgi:tetratricopeptide (TPR) repeat protein